MEAANTLNVVNIDKIAHFWIVSNHPTKMWFTPQKVPSVLSRLLVKTNEMNKERNFE